MNTFENRPRQVNKKVNNTFSSSKIVLQERVRKNKNYSKKLISEL